MRAFEYVNRKGVSYFVHAYGARERGVRYMLKRSREGALRELPAGYEIVENVNAQASVRRVGPHAIGRDETAVVERGLAKRKLTEYRIEVKGLQITVFEPDHDPAELAAEFDPLNTMPAEIGGRLRAMMREPFGRDAVEQYVRERQERVRRRMARTMSYSPVMRFTLVDRESRVFEVARMTYRGEGGWHALGLLPLPAAVAKYVKHLGRESFFELV